MTEPTARWDDFEFAHVEVLAERFAVLRYRDMLSRAITALIATGQHDPARHGDPADYPPLTVAEHLDLLATGEAIARQVRHPAHVHTAVKAGATWPQIAAALGTTTDLARAGYQQWADAQHRAGHLNDAEYTAATEAATRPDDPDDPNQGPPNP